MSKARHTPCFRVLPIIAALVACSAASTLQQQVEQLLEKGGYRPDEVGVLVKDQHSDSTVVSINPSGLFIPASVTKLVTGAVALELLGITYRFGTTVYHDGEFDRESGTVKGNLYIRGGGDPGLSAERLWLFVQHLTHIGVRSVEQDLILDDFLFDSVTLGPGYDEDGSSRAYEAPVAALSANFNTIAVHVAPGGKVGAPVRVTDFPRISGIKIVSTATTVGTGQSGRMQVLTKKEAGGTTIVAGGSMRIDDAPRYVYRRTWETWEHFGRVLISLFQGSGIAFSGTIRHAPVPDSILARGALYRFDSEPVTKSVQNMLKFSNNFAADMLFKTLAAQKGAAPGSWEGGAAVVRDWWTGRGLPDSITIVNGSGMGKINRLSPAQVVALLEYVENQAPMAADFMSGLSIAGYDGTLESRFTRSALRGLVRGKTGTLNSYGTSNLAGYLQLPRKSYVFAVLINCRRITQFSHWVTQQKILETVSAATRHTASPR